MAKRLNQLLAIEKGVKQQTTKELTELHRVSQIPELYDGHAKTYEPLDDEGDRFPPESKILQQKAADILAQVGKLEAKMIDIVAEKDITNCKAKAAIRLDGLEIAPIPAVYLLWLEKRLEDLHTFISKLPTLDSSVAWHSDQSQDCMATEALVTHKSKKVMRNHVKAKATKEHPEQVDVYHEDKVVGNWTNIRYSGRLTVERKSLLIERVRSLQEAVKQAREEANMTEVETITSIGEPMMKWLFA